MGLGNENIIHGVFTLICDLSILNCQPNEFGYHSSSWGGDTFLPLARVSLESGSKYIDFIKSLNSNEVDLLPVKRKLIGSGSFKC